MEAAETQKAIAEGTTVAAGMKQEMAMDIFRCVLPVKAHGKLPVRLSCLSVCPTLLSVQVQHVVCLAVRVCVCVPVYVCFAVCGWICSPKRSREAASNCGPHQMWQQLPPLQCSTTLKIEQIAHIMMRANGISGRLITISPCLPSHC